MKKELLFYAIVATGIGIPILLLLDFLFPKQFKKSFGVPKMDNPPSPPKGKVLPPPPAKAKIHCEYCRNPIDKSERNCYSCGASNKFYKLIPVQKISACDRYEACGFNPFV